MSDPIIPGPTWVDPAEVAVIVGMGNECDPALGQIIAHAEGLCELEIGAQELPLSRGLRSVVTQIAARFWRASQAAQASPEGFSQFTLGGASFSNQGTAASAGLGLTKAEKQALRRAVGKSSLWVLSTTRGPVETSDPFGPHGDPL